MKHARVLLVAVVVAATLFEAHGHGLMTKPEGRPFLAWKDTKRGWPGGPRATEYNPHSMNRGGVCGTSQTDSTRNYNNPKDTSGRPFAPPVTEEYVAGQTYDFEFTLTAHHRGHVELRLCENWRNPTQACFDRHPLTFVSDPIYGANRDSMYPDRGYVAPSSHIDEKVPAIPPRFTSGMPFRMRFKIPEDVSCEHCALQWTYVTANTCNPRGYHGYNFPSDTWWVKNLGNCPWPMDRSGASLAPTPEMFFNCADVRVVPPNGAMIRPPPPTTPSNGRVADWRVCGGINHCGRDEACAECANPRFECMQADPAVHNPWYYQCRPRPATNNIMGSSGGATVTSRQSSGRQSQDTAPSAPHSLMGHWKACGGLSTPTCRKDDKCADCKQGRRGKEFFCDRVSKWHWQCNPRN